MKLILNVESLFVARSGIGCYTHNLLKGLKEKFEPSDLFLFNRLGWVQSFPSADSFLNTSPQSPNVSLKELIQSVPYIYELFTFVRNTSFQRIASKVKGAVYHEPNFILKPYAGPSIATVHDLSHIRYPDFHPKGRVAYLNLNLRRTVEHGQKIITDSSFVRNELIDMMGVSEDKIVAIHPGCSSEFHPRDPSELKKDLRKYNLEPGRYLLSVATLEPRKNLNGLMDAYLRLDSRVRRAYPLVLVGARGWKSQALLDRIRDLSQKGEVITLGYVPESDLPLLYAGARSVAFVPFYEGFGLPALEAMQSGTPLLASNCSSVSEVVGEGALTVDPKDVEAMTAGLRACLEDESLRNGLVKKGLSRANFFSWSQCVAETYNVYESALNS